MAGGSITLFNIAKKKLLDGTLDLDTNTFKAVLLNSSQAMAATFAGTSTDCRYADLTGELATASGYTAGGVTLTGVTLTRSTGTVTWDADDPAWTLTASITARYVAIYASSVTNSPLVAFALLDAANADVSPIAGTFTPNINASGLLAAA